MATNHLERHLECPICYDRFETPKQLPCQHTICLQCLERITASRHILTCPECRQNHTLPASGVSGFPTNITIQRLLEDANLPNVPSLSSNRDASYTRRTTTLSHQFGVSNNTINREPQYHRQSNRMPEVVISPTTAPFHHPVPTYLNRTVSSEDLEYQIALEISHNETRQRRGNERENRDNSGVFKKIRKIFRRFTGKILNEHKTAVVMVIIIFSIVTFSRFVAGAVKLSSECPLERQAAVYMFVKACFAVVFWGALVVWTFKSTLERALYNVCVQVYLVLEALFSLCWLFVGIEMAFLVVPVFAENKQITIKVIFVFCTAWIFGNFSSINDQCTEYIQWDEHFINFAVFLTVVDYIGLVVFLFYSGYTLCDNEEEDEDDI